MYTCRLVVAVQSESTDVSQAESPSARQGLATISTIVTLVPDRRRVSVRNTVVVLFYLSKNYDSSPPSGVRVRPRPLPPPPPHFPCQDAHLRTITRGSSSASVRWGSIPLCQSIFVPDLPNARDCTLHVQPQPCCNCPFLVFPYSLQLQFLEQSS